MPGATWLNADHVRDAFVAVVPACATVTAGRVIGTVERGAALEPDEHDATAHPSDKMTKSLRTSVPPQWRINLLPAVRLAEVSPTPAS
jgi:hypothetical protein